VRGIVSKPYKEKGDHVKDFNAYTVGLAFVGIYAILGHVFTWDIDNLEHFALILGLIVILDVFPIRMPSGLTYSVSIIGFMYTLYEFGLNTLVYVLILSTIISSVALTKRIRDIRLFRILATIGMYYLSLLGSAAVIRATSEWNIAVQVFLAVVTFEFLNMLLLYGIQASLGRKETFQKFSHHFGEIIVPMTICTVVLIRLLMAQDSIHLMMEVFYAAFVLLVIIYLTSQYSRLERESKDSDRKYRLIAENTSDYILVIQPTHEIQYASPSHARGLGFEPSMYIGQPFEAWFHTNDVEDVNDTVEQVVETCQPRQIQAMYKQNNSGWLAVELKCSPVMAMTGEVESLIVVLRDITERQQAEELARKTDKLSVVGQLAAGVAHEIRNPLTAIKGFLQLMKNQIVNVKYYDIMWSEMNRIEFIISEFLILSKPQVVQYQSCDITELLESIIVLFEGQALLHNLIIVKNFAEDLPKIRCEKNQLKQVFINILKNAMESMQYGGEIHVVVDVLDGLGFDTENVVIQFRDEGCGIPTDRLPKLGEPFYTTKEKGTGLGLMVSYNIIEEHKGKLYVTSELGQGTTVEIVLPHAVG